MKTWNTQQSKEDLESEEEISEFDEHKEDLQSKENNIGLMLNSSMHKYVNSNRRKLSYCNSDMARVINKSILGLNKTHDYSQSEL